MGKVYTITGYKSYELGIYSDDHPGINIIKYILKSTIIRLIEDGAEWFMISGQLGVEQWAGEVILELKDDFPEIKLAILTPYLEQETQWKEAAQEHYHLLLEAADFVDSITKRPYENPTQLRLKNEFLVHKSNGLLILYDEETQGSPAYMLSAAQRKRESQPDYHIVTINRFDIELAEQELRESDPSYWSQTD